MISPTESFGFISKLCQLYFAGELFFERAIKAATCSSPPLAVKYRFSTIRMKGTIHAYMGLIAAWLLNAVLDYNNMVSGRHVYKAGFSLPFTVARTPCHSFAEWGGNNGKEI